MDYVEERMASIEGLLNDKAVIVLGASRGIGEEIARSMVSAGARVMLSARNLDALERLANELDPTGERVAAVRLDMTDAGSIELGVAAAVDRFGRLDAAINNAGIQVPRTPLMDVPDEVFDEVIAVNLRGTFIAMKHEARAMLSAGGGAIVNIASAAGIVGIPLVGPYVASKHGVVGLTRSAAVELAAQGVRVNALVPGAVMTDMLRVGPASTPEALAMMLNNIPMRRLGTVSEIASAAVWLASDQASYITGVALPVDGGLTVP